MTATPQLALVLRNGLLLMLSLAAVDRLGLPEGLFLALGILVILEADLGGGVIAGRERVIGSLMGLLAVVITAGITVVLPLPARVFSGLLLVRLFGFAAGLSSGFIVGGHVVAGSLLHHPDNWWYYAFWRTVMTILGVLIGVYISRQLYSQRSVSRWREQCRSWTGDLAHALLHLGDSPDRAQLFQDLRERRNALRRSLPQLIAEQSVTHSRQDSVRGLVRLISSARTRFANSGPGTNRKVPLSCCHTEAPITSLGIRSLVNWTRRNSPSMQAASALARSVLPIPGMPSTSAWPPATSAQSSGSTASLGSLTTCVRLRVSRSRARRGSVVVGVAVKGVPRDSSAAPGPAVSGAAGAALPWVSGQDCGVSGPAGRTRTRKRSSVRRPSKSGSSSASTRWSGLMPHATLSASTARSRSPASAR